MATIFSASFFDGAITVSGQLLFTVPAGEVWKLKYAHLWCGPSYGSQMNLQLERTGAGSGASIDLMAGIINALWNPYSARDTIRNGDNWHGSLTFQPGEGLVAFTGSSALPVGVTLDGFRFKQ